MASLCERPGCSENAAVAYGMRAEDLVFWLDVLDEHRGPESGVLCLRHANSMVVPRGWTLDDLRDPDLRLFRPPVSDDGPKRRTSRVASAVPETADQLELGIDAADDAGASADASSSPAVAPVGDVVGGVTVDDAEPDRDGDAAPWVPSFDSDDDLDGLLSARSPLLARAFRGDDRPR